MDNDSTSTPVRNAVGRFFNELHGYRNAVLKWWWLLLLLVGGAVGARYFVFSHTPPSYKSDGLMIVNVKLSLPSGNVYSEELNNFLGTQAALLQSDTVSNRALISLREDRPDLQPEPVTLHVNVSPKTSIFELRAVGPDGRYAQAWLNHVMDEYSKVKKEMVQRTSENTRLGLGEAITNLYAELQKGKQEFEDYGTSNSVVFLQDQGNSAANRLAELTKQRDDLQAELQLLKILTLDENVDIRQTMVQQNLVGGAPGKPGATQQPASPAPDPNQNRGVENSSEDQTRSNLVGSEGDYLKAKQHVAVLEGRWNELSVYLRPQHPKMVELKEDIDRQKNLLEIFKSQTQEQLSSREHALDLQIRNLDDQIGRWTASTLDISKKMADYTAIKERNQRLETMYDNLVTSEHSVAVERQINPESVAILQAATLPSIVVRDLFKQLLLAALVGLALGVAAIIVLRRLDDRPNSFTELQDLFDETVLGQIPHLRVKDKKAGIPIIQEDDERHAFAEAYRNLRSSIMFQGATEKQARIILVTSAIPGDGKSMTTANLAIMLARSEHRVLLVDADMRRGRVHKQFGLPLSPGLAEVLSEQRAWSTVVTQNSVPNLYIVSRGSAPRHPGELLVKSMKEQFLKEAGEKFDFILLDSPPVMATDDVSNLTPYVDGVLMVIRANYTSGRVARAALDLLYLRKAKVLGLVFNGVKSRGGDYYYYKYKEYYASNPA